MKLPTFLMCSVCLACLAVSAHADINIFSPRGERHESNRHDRDESDDQDGRDRDIRLPADTRVDLTAVLSKDFIGSPSFDQAVEALNGDQPLFGFGWEVIMDHIGFGGQYLVNFHEDDPDSWWLDWNGQGIYVSYHFFGTRSFIDPFINGGMGCAGRVFLGPEDQFTPGRLALTLYPFAGAGVSVCLDHFKLGAKLDYALKRSGIPATDIADYPLGRFQVSLLAGVSFGAGPTR
jgi:hypothetical protein